MNTSDWSEWKKSDTSENWLEIILDKKTKDARLVYGLESFEYAGQNLRGD